MRAWRVHQLRPAARRAAARRGAGAGARPGRAAGAGPGHPAQPQRPRAHHRRQHDGAPRAALQPRHGGHGTRRGGRRRRRGVHRAGGCRPRPRGPSAATPSTRSARRSRRSRCPTTIAMPDAAALFFPFHLAWLGLFDRAELTAGETVLIHAAAGGSGLGRHPAGQGRRRAGDRHVRQRREGGAVPRARRRRRHRLHGRGLRRGRAGRDRQPRRRRGVRQRRRGGVGRRRSSASPTTAAT